MANSGMFKAESIKTNIEKQIFSKVHRLLNASYVPIAMAYIIFFLIGNIFSIILQFCTKKNSDSFTNY